MTDEELDALAERLLGEAAASEELDPTNSSIAEMREAADALTALRERVKELTDENNQINRDCSNRIGELLVRAETAEQALAALRKCDALMKNVVKITQKNSHELLAEFALVQARAGAAEARCKRLAAVARALVDYLGEDRQVGLLEIGDLIEALHPGDLSDE